MNVMIYAVMIIVAFAIGMMTGRKTESKPKKRGRSKIWKYFFEETDDTHEHYNFMGGYTES